MPEAYAELLNPATFAGIDELRRRAAARGWSLPRAALRYVLDTPGVDSLIVAPRSLEQFAGYAIDLPQPGGGAPGNA